jgi:hypothetical protein
MFKKHLSVLFLDTCARARAHTHTHMCVHTFLFNVLSSVLAHNSLRGSYIFYSDHTRQRRPSFVGDRISCKIVNVGHMSVKFCSETVAEKYLYVTCI